MIISKQQFLINKTYFRKISKGAVFIYPTDTIYGLGCDATNSRAVNKIRRIKKRSTAPFSIAVPSKAWIKQNCMLSKDAEKWLKKLPGPYTFLLKLKNKKAIAKAVIPKTNIIGIRMPNNWFAKATKKLGIPIVSTSANITKQSHMTSLKDLNKQVANNLDFIIYDGKKHKKPSKIIDFSKEKPKIVKR